MVNNFVLINDFIEFKNERSFYFVQILKRKKENPEMKSYSQLIESFYIFSHEQFERVMPHIIEKCEQNRARAYFKMNCLDAESVGLKAIAVLAQTIRDNEWKALSSAFNSACGQCGKQDGTITKYLVDIDDEYINELDEIKHEINYNFNPIENKNKIILEVPTRHGVHLITTGFDISLFKQKYPNIDIHKEGMTLLYFPSCCD